jgi:hypothetical protein
MKTIQTLLALGGVMLGAMTGFAQPAITIQPTNQIVLNGSNAVFSVTATGSGLLSYQWRFNGINLSNAAGQPIRFYRVSTP